MQLIGLRRQKRLQGKINGYKDRVNGPQLWLAILLLALPTQTNMTIIKQKKDGKETNIDLKTNDKSKDVNLPTNDNNSFTFDNFITQTKNESYFSRKDYSQTNKENESNLRSTHMAITGKVITNKDNNSQRIDDTVASNNGRGLYDKNEKDNSPKRLGLNIFNLNSDKPNKTITSRHSKRKVVIDDKLESLLSTNINFDSNDKFKGGGTRKLNTNKVEHREISNAIDFGIKALEELVTIKEPQLYKQGIFLDKDHPAARVASFGAPISQKAILMSRIGYATLEASKKIAQAYPQNVGRQSAGIPDELQSRIDLDVCPLKGLPRCLPASRRFRTSDGTCNNLEHPWRGAAMLPMQRFLPPVYEDGIQSVRLSVFGEPLPSARDVSTIIHRDKNREIQSVTMMFTQWGQFIDHDITSTVKARSFNGSIPRCCQVGGRGMLPPDLLHPSCLPIEVPRTDPFLSRFGIGCMEFIRSAPSTRIDCELGWREQINQVTPYIDASTIYGSDVDTSDSIRMFRGGQIIYGRPQNPSPLNPPDPPDGDLCRAGALSEECLQPGDARVSENPGLIALHTIFIRYHNKVATVLSKINNHWSDEKVYQETRKIVYSVIQHITYREYLPVVLGPEVMDIFELRVLKKGYYNKYNKRIIPAIANSFGAAAFRFGHSMVQNSYIRTDSQHIPLPNNVSLHEEISNFNHIWTFGSMDRVLLGFTNQPSQRRDEFIADELTNHLFQFSDDIPFGMDLAAINIQRGRDHGIPPYTCWRKPCGLSPVTKWRDLEKIMSQNSISRLQSLYLHVDDIDLFTGGLAEKPLRGGVVGPTFACIIAQQFSNLRRGDRFWYENKGFESSFSLTQLQEIRKVSLAQIICQTTDEVETIQPFVFLSADKMKNTRVTCDSPDIRNFDLGAWTEKSFEFNSISENLDPFEQERSQNSNNNFIRQRRVIDRKNLKARSTKNTTERKFDNLKPKRLHNTSQNNKHLTNNLSYPTRHRRDAPRAKRKTKTSSTSKPPKTNTLKAGVKTNITAKKLPKTRATTLKPIQITSIPFEVKFGGFNDVPKKPTFAAHTTVRPTKKKPQYYQIQDQNHDDVTYLFGILPKHTTKAPKHMTPIQVNININYSAHPTATTTNVSPKKKKKRPYVTTSSNLLTNDYNTPKPLVTGTHKPTNLYGQNDIVIITKRPATSTKWPVTQSTITSTISYPIFIYNTAHERPNSYEVTTRNPTHFLDNDHSYNKPADIFHRPINDRPSVGYYADGSNEDDRYVPIDTKPSTYESNNNHKYHAYVTSIDKKPIYISTSDYNDNQNPNRPSLFENQPFSTSNKQHYNTYSNKRPISNYYFNNDSESDVVILTKPKRRPETTASNKDETYFTDDILDGFFNRRYDKIENTDKKNNDKSHGIVKTNLNIDGMLDFKSRIVYKKEDKSNIDKDTFVEISSVKKEEFIGTEDVTNQEIADQLNGKSRKKRRSVNGITVVNVDVMPSESRNERKYFNATEEPTAYMEVPELSVNMPCSYEVPKPINFTPSNG